MRFSVYNPISSQLTYSELRHKIIQSEGEQNIKNKNKNWFVTFYQLFSSKLKNNEMKHIDFFLNIWINFLNRENVSIYSIMIYNEIIIFFFWKPFLILKGNE